jgi:ribonuclease HIII
MNFKNLAENLIIVIVAVTIGGYVGYKASKESNKQTIQLLTPAIMEAIKKETTAIKNEFNTEIKKVKNRKGVLTLDVKPIIDNQIKQKNTRDTTAQNVVQEPKKTNWFKRLFKNNSNN